MNESVTEKSIGVVGLGNMGSALAAALLARNYPVTVWNRTASKADALVEQGATLAPDVAEAARLADTIIICVAGQSVIESLLHNDDVGEALRDKNLVQLSVVTPPEALVNAGWAQSSGIAYLEGSILGVPENIVAGEGIIVCSGAAERYAEQKPLLEVFGTTYHLSDSIGAAYQIDKLCYPFGYGAMLGYIQGATMARASGYSIEAYTGILLDWVKVLPDRLGNFGDLIGREDFTAQKATLEVWATAYEKCLDLCRSLGVDDTLPKAHMAVMAKGIDEGFEEEEILAVFKTLLPKPGMNDGDS